MNTEVNNNWLSTIHNIPEHNSAIYSVVSTLWNQYQTINLIPLHLPYRNDAGGVRCTCKNPQCTSQGKHPLHSGWQHKETDPIKIKALFRERLWFDSDGQILFDGELVCPNIGFEPGSIGLVAIDLDTYKEKYAGDKLDLPHNTLTQKARGTHLFYKVLDGIQLGNNRGKLPDGVDVKSTSGFVVLAPSLHLTGIHYELSDRLDLDKVLDIPESLLDLLLDAQNKAPTGTAKSVVIDKTNVPRLPESRYKGIKNQEIRRWILEGYPNIDGTQRYKKDASICDSLFALGFTVTEVYSTFKHYPCGTAGKYSTTGEAYLTTTIKNAFCYMEGKRAERELAAQTGYIKGLVAPWDNTENDADYIERMLQVLTLEDTANTVFDELWFNLDEERIYLGEEPLTDNLYTLVVAKFETVNKSPKRDRLETRIMEISHRHRRSPMRDYFENLVWDGKSRLRDFAEFYLRDDDTIVHYEDNHDEFIRCVYFPKWMVGVVAKLYTQGAYQNPVLVLVGEQGGGKATFSRWLASGMGEKYYTEGALNPDDDDHKVRAATHILWELSELGATTRRADMESLKSHLTQQYFDLRLKYAKKPVRLAHRASYIGTVNPGAAFLNDQTGNRRYMILNLESINWDYSKDVAVNQLWAEAVHLFKNGYECKLTTEEATVRDEQNELHNVENIMESNIARFCIIDPSAGGFISTADLVAAFIDLPTCKGKGERAMQTEIAAAMNKLGVKKTKRRVNTVVPVQGYAGVKINHKALADAKTIRVLST